MSSFRFSDDGESIIGPAAYMRDPFGYSDFLKEGTRGSSYQAVIIAAGCNGEIPTAREVYLQAVQLHYANWHGTASLLAGLNVAKPNPPQSRKPKSPAANNNLSLGI